MRSECLQDEKSFGDGDGYTGNVNVLHATELSTENCLTVNFMLCAFLSQLKKFKSNQSTIAVTLSKWDCLKTMQCAATQAHPTWGPPLPFQASLHYGLKFPTPPHNPPGADSAS